MRSDGTLNDVRCVSIEHKLGIHASPTCVMAFGDNDACEGELIGPPHGGMRAMFTMMNNARMNVGLQGVSVAEAATQQAVAYARERVQGARGDAAAAIIDYPDVRRMLLRMKALTQGARALTYYMAAQVDRAEPRRRSGRRAGAAADTAGEGVGHGRGLRSGQPRRPDPRRHGLCRGDRRRPILSRYPHRADLRRHQRHPGRGPGRAQAGAARRRRAAQPAGRDPHVAGREDTSQELAAAVEEVASSMASASPDDRLAGSYPLLTMLSVLVAGWLMARQETIAASMLGGGEGDPMFLRMKAAASAYFRTPSSRRRPASSQPPCPVDESLLYAVPAEASRPKGRPHPRRPDASRGCR
jgi:hypothetical protein